MAKGLPSPAQTPPDDHSLSTLHTRITTLLSEITLFKSMSTTLSKPIYIARLENEVRRELRSCERVLALSPSSANTTTSVPSLNGGWNISKFEAVWAYAKYCTGVVALRKVFGSVLADVVADDGRDWVKVYTTSERRVLFDLAKEGWFSSEDQESEEDGDEESEVGGGGIGDEIGLVERVRDLVIASKGFRVKCQHPHVHIILTRIREGSVPEIDILISQLRATGATVECQQVTPSSPDYLVSETTKLNLKSAERLAPGVPLLNGTQTSQPVLESTSLNTLFTSMLSPPTPTPTLNIDTTLLLALISDISHTSPATLLSALSTTSSSSPSPGRLRLLQRQIDAEAQEALVPARLYPVLGGRELVCTDEAARVTREITEKIGTEAEVKRMRILFGEADEAGGIVRTEALIMRFQDLSIHPVPKALRLPIKIIPFNVTTYLQTSPPFLSSSAVQLSTSLPAATFIAQTTALTSTIRHLSPLNLSVFAYGWSRDLTTLTRSFMVAGAIESTVGALFDEVERREGVDPLSVEGVVAPKMVVVDVERGLFGRQEERRVSVQANGNGDLEAERLERRERRKVLRGKGAVGVGVGACVRAEGLG